MTLFLDASAIIYLIEAQEPFYSSYQAVLRNLVDANPDTSVAISSLSILECLVLPLRVEQCRIFFAKQGLNFLS